jgi:hypothetical protein
MLGEDMKLEDELLNLLYEERQNTNGGFIPEEKLVERLQMSTTYLQPYIHTFQEDGIVGLKERYWEVELLADID